MTGRTCREKYKYKYKYKIFVTQRTYASRDRCKTSTSGCCRSFGQILHHPVHPRETPVPARSRRLRCQNSNGDLHQPATAQPMCFIIIRYNWQAHNTIQARRRDNLHSPAAATCVCPRSTQYPHAPTTNNWQSQARRILAPRSARPPRARRKTRT